MHLAFCLKCVLGVKSRILMFECLSQIFLLEQFSQALFTLKVGAVWSSINSSVCHTHAPPAIYIVEPYSCTPSAPVLWYELISCWSNNGLSGHTIKERMVKENLETCPAQSRACISRQFVFVGRQKLFRGSTTAPRDCMVFPQWSEACNLDIKNKSSIP